MKNENKNYNILKGFIVRIYLEVNNRFILRDKKVFFTIDDFMEDYVLERKDEGFDVSVYNEKDKYLILNHKDDNIIIRCFW